MSDANLSYSCKKTELVKLFFVLLYFCSGMRLFFKGGSFIRSTLFVLLHFVKILLKTRWLWIPDFVNQK